MLKLFMLIGIAAVTNHLPVQINAQWWENTYHPTSYPTSAEEDDDDWTTYPPTSGEEEEEAAATNPPTKSPEIAALTTSPPTTAKQLPTATAEELSCPPSTSWAYLPSSQSSTIEIDSISTLSYAIIPSNPPASNNGIFCAKLTTDNIGWTGLGISPDGLMSGSVAIVGLPNDNSVLKYSLGSGRSVNPMPAEQQTLRDTSIVQQDGQTIMTFTKLLVEQDELPILIENGSTNIFIHARGMGNALGYHGSSNRLSFQIEFGGDDDADATGGEDQQLVFVDAEDVPDLTNLTRTASPTLSPSTVAPLPVPKPWNDRPMLTPSPTSNSTMSPTTATDNNNSTGTNSPTAPLSGYDGELNSTNSSINYVLPGESSGSSNIVSALQGSSTASGGASSMAFIFRDVGLVPLVVALVALYFL